MFKMSQMSPKSRDSMPYVRSAPGFGWNAWPPGHDARRSSSPSAKSHKQMAPPKGHLGQERLGLRQEVYSQTSGSRPRLSGLGFQNHTRSSPRAKHQLPQVHVLLGGPPAELAGDAAPRERSQELPGPRREALQVGQALLPRLGEDRGGLATEARHSNVAAAHRPALPRLHLRQSSETLGGVSSQPVRNVPEPQERLKPSWISCSHGILRPAPSSMASDAILRQGFFACLNAPAARIGSCDFPGAEWPHADIAHRARTIFVAISQAVALRYHPRRDQLCTRFKRWLSTCGMAPVPDFRTHPMSRLFLSGACL